LNSYTYQEGEGKETRLVNPTTAWNKKFFPQDLQDQSTDRESSLAVKMEEVSRENPIIRTIYPQGKATYPHKGSLLPARIHGGDPR
jgi:hypothetical protein